MLQGEGQIGSEPQGATRSWDGCCCLSLCCLILTKEEPSLGLLPKGGKGGTEIEVAISKRRATHEERSRTEGRRDGVKDVGGG